MRICSVNSLRSTFAILALTIDVAMAAPSSGQQPISDRVDETDTTRSIDDPWLLLGREIMTRRVPECTDRESNNTIATVRLANGSRVNESLAREATGNAIAPLIRAFRTWGVNLLLLTYALVMIIMLHRRAAGKQNRQ